MFPKKYLLLGLGFLATQPTSAQWIRQNSGTDASFRAVSAVSAKVAWVGGSKGTLLRTTDGGRIWEIRRPAGAEALDFRDIHAFNSNAAVAMSAGLAENGQARIYRTPDGGLTWILAYQTTRKGVFLDGIDFFDDSHGLCFGDPVDGKFFVLTTADGGQTWQEVPRDAFPSVQPGEAAFAASGTSLVALRGTRQAWICTGGAAQARVFASRDGGQTWQVAETPMPGNASSGLFGLRFWSATAGVAVGGDYKKTSDSSANVLLTNDGGRTWQPTGPMRPGGLKEGVALTGKTLVAVGPSGSGISRDYGKTWLRLDTTPFHAVSFAGASGWAVGGAGAIARFKSQAPVVKPRPKKAAGRKKSVRGKRRRSRRR
ncbi:MAG: oxidoreductase [Sphingobacteriaceae bacterium]|nr:oxidoreductase [Cytophagaceae bacterium]